MPQNFALWQEHLNEIGDADYFEYINKIGNLTLTKLNSELSNAPFEAKKAIYKDSGYKMTREIAEYKDWSSAEIKKRSADMAEIALKLWPLPEAYNNSDNNATYKFEDNKLLDALRNAVKNYDASIKEDIKKLYINFILNEKIILSVIPAQSYLFVNLKAHKEQLTPNDIIEDLSNKGHWGVGNSRMKVTKEKDIPQVIYYVKQMIELKLV